MKTKRLDVTARALAVLPPRRRKLWVTALQIAALDPKLRTRSLHPALEYLTRTGRAERRKNELTGRWEYARAAQ